MVELKEGISLPDEVVATMRCPRCRQQIVITTHVECVAGHTFPIVRRVPRLLVDAWTPEASASVAATQRAFGDQWSELGDDAKVTTADLALHLPRGWAVEETFRGLALDVGCGMGRYTALVTDLGAKTVGLDVSRAVDKAARTWPEIPFVQADIAAAPFVDRSFDLVYSFGVLHHLPEPQRGLNECWRLVRSGGTLLVWVYSDRGGILRGGRRAARAVVSRVPAVLPIAARLAAAAIWGLRRVPGPGRARLRFYADKSFRQIYVDCHDALAAPLETYVSEADCRAWLDDLAPASAGYEGRRDDSGWIIWAKRAQDAP